MNADSNKVDAMLRLVEARLAGALNAHLAHLAKRTPRRSKRTKAKRPKSKKTHAEANKALAEKRQLQLWRN